jgi:hypothetical protein
MMQIRCQTCAWLITLNDEAIAQALTQAQVAHADQHVLNCPKCGSTIKLQVVEMRQQLPADHAPSPSLDPQPTLASVPVLPPSPPKASPSPMVAPAAKALATNIAFIPQWDPKRKRDVTQFLFRLVIAVVAAAWIVTLYWLFAQPITKSQANPLPAGVDLAVVLAPVLAAAAGVERFLETIFGVIEQSWMTLVAYLGRGLRWLHGAETEIQQARKWLAEVSYEADNVLKRIPTTPEQLQAMIPDQIDQGKTLDEWQNEIMAQAQKQLDTASRMKTMAEKRLSDAEAEMASGVDSPTYKSAKRAASIVVGLWLGLIVATIGQLQMFALLGVSVVPARVDVLITGLVIGSGSYPVHSLVGLLQQARDTLDSTQSFLKSKSSPPQSSGG